MCDDAFELLETERYPTFIPYENEKKTKKETSARRRMQFIPDAVYEANRAVFEYFDTSIQEKSMGPQDFRNCPFGCQYYDYMTLLYMHQFGVGKWANFWRDQNDRDDLDPVIRKKLHRFAEVNLS